MKKILGLLLISSLALGFTACDDDDENGSGTNTSKLEDLSMTPEWVNYTTAASSELLDDCIMLWAAWNGSDGISSKDMERIGSDFFTKNPQYNKGYAYLLKTAGQTDNVVFKSQEDAIRTILSGGFANISNEVGANKIGDPNGLAKAGKTEEAVLQVESWYSWNSITDYSDNIISIKNGYCGRIGAIDAPVNTNSISAYVKNIDSDLDKRVNDAIDNAYYAIQNMQAPFRSNLTGTKVDAAMDACADLTEIIEGELYAKFQSPVFDFSEILRVYADEVVVPTYKDMKDKAWVLFNAVEDLQKDNKNQTKLNSACIAWRETRIPWEQSEAVLYGPASEDALALDPSLDSWPLDQEDIAGILIDKRYSTVEQYINAISAESVRGFHTIELLLFKDGKNRTVLE